MAKRRQKYNYNKSYDFKFGNKDRQINRETEIRVQDPVSQQILQQIVIVSPIL